MKKGLKIILIVIGVVLGIILLDTIQAKVFNNSPIIRIKTNIYSECYKKVEGIFVSTTIYYNEDKTTYFNWEVSDLMIKMCEDPFKVVVEQLNEVNDIIVNKLMYQTIPYDNYRYHYIDTDGRIIVVGLEDNNEEEQEWFKENIVDSDYLYFEKGTKPTDNPKPVKIIESFLGKVVESNSSSIIVEPNEDEPERKTADRFFIKLIDNSTTYDIGMIVDITYEGLIRESYPAQVNAINITIVKE